MTRPAIPLRARTLPPGYRIIVGQGEANAETARAFWATPTSLETVTRAMANSLCAVVTFQSRQVGIARIVTDHATIAMLADIFVAEEHRHRGLAGAMIAALQDQTDLLDVRWLMFDSDGYGMPDGLGWTPIDRADRVLVPRSQARKR